MRKTIFFLTSSFLTLISLTAIMAAVFLPAAAFGVEGGHWSKDGLGKWVTESKYENAVKYLDENGHEIDMAQDGLSAGDDGNLTFTIVMTLAPGHPSLNHMLKLNDSTEGVTMEPTVDEWYEEELYGQLHYREAKITWSVKAAGLEPQSTCSLKLSVSSNFETYINDSWEKAPKPANVQEGNQEAPSSQPSNSASGGGAKDATSEKANTEQSGGESASLQTAEPVNTQATDLGDSTAESKLRKGGSVAAKVSVYKVGSGSAASAPLEFSESKDLPFGFFLGLALLGLALAGAVSRLTRWRIHHARIER